MCQLSRLHCKKNSSHLRVSLALPEPAKLRLIIIVIIISVNLQSCSSLAQNWQPNFPSGAHVSPRAANCGGSEDAEQLLPAVKLTVWVWVAVLQEMVIAQVRCVRLGCHEAW